MTEEFLVLREQAKGRRNPTVADDTLAYLLALAEKVGARRILEIGTAEGLTAAALAMALPDAEVTTVEIDEERHSEAEKNIRRFGLEARVTAVLGDAADILPTLAGEFDLIFLDGPKAQYLNYLPEMRRLLRTGGVLAADDVLLFGWVDGSVPCPPKRRSIAGKLRGYLDAVRNSPDWRTEIVRTGEGLAVSVKLG